LSIADDGASAIVPRRFARGPVFDALSGAAILVMAEWTWVSLAARNEFAGTWELVDGLTGVVPLTWILASFGALAGALALALARSTSLGARIGLGLLAAGAAAAIGLGVTQGRHFAALAVRVPFVGAMAVVSFALAFTASPWAARVSSTAPRQSALAGAALALGFTVVNHAVLPRLYPAFHLGLALFTVMTAPVIGRGFRAPRAPDDIGRFAPAISLAALLLAIAAAPRIAERISRVDNLRMIFLDRTILLALGVELGARLAPPAPLAASVAPEERHSDEHQAIDWRGKDILLITVDALRADHVGAYGYPRPTTPALDELARKGVLFSRAYCPTPHTSYSVASLMTGKNLHPLLVQGLGADSDTIAGLTRIYGYRTAAFYPPAVFFIDEELFSSFRDRKLDFEYARVEFAEPSERAEAVTNYLATQPRDQRVFLWVHLFEPHEPYVAHAAYDFGDRDVDRYDGEVAFADAGIGRIVRAMRSERPETVVIVTADHGEEFGEHRGRYHGTTVYEEQVRVPLVVEGPGVPAGRRVQAPVQTIDILPTVLGALDIPRPPRIGGHDLGHWMRPPSSEVDLSSIGEGTSRPDAIRGVEAPAAISETDDQILLADAMWRLVCARRAGACALYDLNTDPEQAHDVSTAHRDRFQTMKAALRRIETTRGHYEAAQAGVRPWPVPIRRGLGGDADAAPEIAELLDDSDASFRRKAAELLFQLKRPEAAAPLRLALTRDEDATVRRWAALALARLGQSNDLAIELMKDEGRETRRLAALSLGENGDARGTPVLVEWWQSERLPYTRAREVLAALAKVRAKEAVMPLIASLGDLRLRPLIADTLAAIGQPAARAPLAEHLARERNKDTRFALAAALVKLGARSELAPSLFRFLGTPDPLPDGVDMARRAGLLSLIGTSEDDLERLRVAAGAGASVRFKLARPGDAAAAGGRPSTAPDATYRLLVRATTSDTEPGRVTFTRCLPRDDRDPSRPPTDDAPRVALEFPSGSARELFVALPRALAGSSDGQPVPRDVCLAVERTTNLAIEGIAIVPLADEIPPPPPEPWEAAGVLPRLPVPREAGASAPH
jgi:arylsulfatase A-like enzyme/HEAT repeat protein